VTGTDHRSPKIHQQIAEEIASMEPRTPPEPDPITFDDVVPLIHEMVLEAPLGLDRTEIEGNPNRGYNLGALTRALLLKRVHPKITSDKKLCKHLEDHRHLLAEFGFEKTNEEGELKVPSKNPFSNAREERLRDGYHEVILIQIAEPIISDLKRHPCYAHLCDDEEETFTVNQVLTAADKTIGTVLNHVVDDRDSARTDYEWRNILEYLCGLAKTDDFASQPLRAAKRENGDLDDFEIPDEKLQKFDDGVPAPRSLFKALEQHDPEDYWEMFEDVLRELYKKAERFGLFDRPVELLIDGTTIPYYPSITVENEDGEEEFDLPEGVTGGAKAAHTHYGFTFFTVSLADPNSGRTYTLGTFPKWDTGLTHEGVTYLLKKAREYVSIDLVYMDAEFRAIENLNWMDERGIDFVGRYTKKDWRKDWVKALTGEATAATLEYEIAPSNKSESGEYTFLAVRRKSGDPDLDLPEEDKNHTIGDFLEAEDLNQSQLGDFDEYLEEADGAWDIYVTNIEDASAATARDLGNDYNRRSAIEVEYDTVKNELLPSGGGRNYEVRVLYWMLAVTLLNALKIMDLLLKEDTDQDASDEYAVPPKEIVTLLFPNPFLVEYG